MSYTTFKLDSLRLPGRLCVKLFAALGLVDIRPTHEGSVECSNMTLINLLLKLLGATHERTLTVTLLLTQVSMLPSSIALSNHYLGLFVYVPIMLNVACCCRCAAVFWRC